MVQQNIVTDNRPLTPIFNGSLGEFLFKKWQERRKDTIMQINATEDILMTYEESLVKSVQIAEGLRTLGLKPQDVVAFYGLHSLNLINTAYAVQFLGGVVAPVDPEVKVHELSNTLSITKPRLILADVAKLDVLKESIKDLNVDLGIMLLDGLETETEYKRVDEFYKIQVDVSKFVPNKIQNPKNDICLMLCTSGTTGYPKVVGIPHAGMLSQVKLWEEYIRLPPVYIVMTQFFWISSIIPWLLAPLGLRRIFLKTLNLGVFLRAVDKYKAQGVYSTPAFYVALTNHPDLHKYDMTSLQRIMVGSNAVKQSFVDLMNEKWPNKSVEYNQGYGATELAGLVFMFSPQNKLLSTGTVMPGNQLKIADTKTGEALGPNQEGEMWHRSPSMMKGYVDNEEATKEVLDADGWYHSGDLGYYDEDGYVYVVGRIKDIFKYRAKHISPADMEGIIAGLPGVREVAVTAIPHDIDSNHAIALVVKKEGSNITEDDVKNIILENMSEGKELAAGAIFVDSLPSTATGKLKRPDIAELAIKLHKARATAN